MTIQLAFTHHSLVPVRSTASDSEEMVTQLLFGDLVEVLESHQQWRRIQIQTDGYEGWVDHKMIELIPSDWPERIQEWKFVYDSACQVDCSFKGQLSKLSLTLGCSIPITYNNNGVSELAINVGDFQAHFSLDHLYKYNKPLRESVIENSLRYLGAPYLWGGKSLWGIDCSGLTQMVYRLSEVPISLKRDASQQVQQGREVQLRDALPGDLAFFKNPKGKVTHVGIMLNEGKIIHASGRVRLDSLTEEGIIHAENGELSHQSAVIKQYINEDR